LLALSLVLLPAQKGRPTAEYVAGQFGNAAFILACSAVGLLIVSRYFGNRIGWIYLLVALAYAAGQFAGSYAARSLPGAAWVALVPDLLWIGTVPLGATLLLLLFPTGHLPSPRWRSAVWAAVTAALVVVVATALIPRPTKDLPTAQNPLGLEGAGPALDLIVQAAFLVIIAALFAAAGSLIMRWRRARGVERQQLKWLAYAAGMLMVSQVIGTSLPHALYLVIANSIALLFPVATGIAILRYRLYDIDRLINRTLVYGLLTALLSGVYAGAVLVLGQLFGGFRAEPPTWAVAGVTLTVAALFQPARRHIQHAVDRRFNRRSYNAAKTIEAFSARLREEVDLDTLSTDLLAAVDHTMQPTAASLWLRPSVQRTPHTRT
jgi:hypothetical protein